MSMSIYVPHYRIVTLMRSSTAETDESSVSDRSWRCRASSRSSVQPRQTPLCYQVRLWQVHSLASAPVNNLVMWSFAAANVELYHIW